MYDVIIAGAGTAGLTAAIYVQRAGKRALVLDGAGYGGQIINTPEVENYPGISKISGFEFATDLLEQAKGLGAVVEFEEVLDIEPVEGNAGIGFVEKLKITGNAAVEQEEPCMETSGEQKIEALGHPMDRVVRTAAHCYRTHAVILATGLTRRKLGLPGEDHLLGRGLSYCATCDGAFYRKKIVAVNGGGNTAVEDAVFLARLCEKVYLIHRRDRFRADEAEIRKLSGLSNVELVLNSTVSGWKTGEDGKLRCVQVTDKWTGEKRELPVSGLFVAIGQVPAGRNFDGVVEMDESGYIIAGEDCRTSAPGIFAAGDCRTKKIRQLVTAASDGAVAGMAACSYADDLTKN